jgi:hypothetical protein
MKVIGIPDVIQGMKVQGSDELLKLATLNKIALLYSKSLQADGLYKELAPKHELLLETVKDVTSVFNQNSINYSIFKTLKPFPTTPSDVDVLLSKQDFARAEMLLTSGGYRQVANDAFTSTLTKKMNVDLQIQPSVSNLPYLSKTFLMENTERRNLGELEVNCPTTEAEIIVIASHSLYKEQMFTLNDYYTITLLAERADIDNLINLAKKAKVLEAVRLALTLCSNITQSVFNVELQVSRIGRTLGFSNTTMPKTLPVKFPFSLVVKLLAIKACKDEEMRRMVAPAIMRLATPGQLKRLISHITRSTY